MAHPPSPEVLETARVVAARASLRALRLAPTPLTAQRSAAMEMVLLPLELGGCGTMDPATNLAKDIDSDSGGTTTPGCSGEEGVHHPDGGEATRDQPMGGMTGDAGGAYGGSIRCGTG